MSSSTVTMIGYYDYLKGRNTDLFKNLTVPDGIDKDVLINNILLQSANFEMYYADPYFMQEAIAAWSGKWQRTMQKWYDALQIEYDPLENYDRKEEWSDNTSGTGSSINQVSAYDSSTMQNDSQQNLTSTTGSSHSGRTHGNIGVTTSQQMLQAELDLAEWNLIEKITTLFLSEFCIPIY